MAAGVLPWITNHIAQISKALATRQLETVVHRRKWSLVINGVAGAANEKEEDTRAALVERLSRYQMQTPPESAPAIALAKTWIPVFYLRFTDLHERNKWLSQAKQLNTLRPRRSRRHFADDSLRYIFLNENIWISIRMSLKFIAKGPINDIPTLVQIMAWRRPGDKPLSEPMMVSLLTHIGVTWPQWVKGN